MSLLGSKEKQPADVLDYDIDYRDWLTEGDNVQSTTVTVSPSGELSVDSIFNNDPVVKIWVSGGNDKTTYKLTVTTSTADGRVKQDEFKIKVKDS